MLFGRGAENPLEQGGEGADIEILVKVISDISSSVRILVIDILVFFPGGEGGTGGRHRSRKSSKDHAGGLGSRDCSYSRVSTSLKSFQPCG